MCRKDMRLYGWRRAIRDGVVTVEIRAIETTKEVAVKYYIEAEDRTIDGQSVKADKDATYINTSILKDVPNGYDWYGPAICY